MEFAEKENGDWVMVDGAPGIDCPVIASLSGVNRAVAMTEPILSGLHDAKRVIDVAGHFNVPTTLIVNKYDLNVDMAGNIETYCKNSNLEFVRKIDFDES